MKLSSLLDQLYPGKTNEILQALKPSLTNPHFKEQLAPDWFAHLQFYTTYPDSFKDEQDHANLQSLTQNLKRISNLGCNALHLLPFFTSPQIDGGFDVSDYYNINPQFGTMEDFDQLLKTARTHAIEVFIDFPLNHVSTLHPWFIEATKGNQYFRDFFIHTVEKPNLIKFDTENGNLAHYDVFGKEVIIPIIFKDQAGELPSWHNPGDGYWYFHSFYPTQIDLNWNNSEVFLQIAKVLVFWAKKGVSFRIDAAPHLDKQFDGFLQRNTKRNHQLVKALRQVVHLANPGCVFLVEVVDNLQTVTSYFNQSSNNLESELAYNLPLLNGLWASLVLYNSEPLWQTLGQTTDIPPLTQWVTFLRCHDALMLGFLDSNIPNQVYKELVKLGLPFDGIQVAGRLASLLDQNPARIITAMLLLASVPGNPTIFYGDEFGKINDLEYMESKANAKRTTLNSSIKSDAREAGRGQVTTQLATSPTALNLASTISRIFSLRLTIHSLHAQQPKQLPGPSTLFCAQYSLSFNQSLIVVINLSAALETYQLPEGHYSLQLSINKATLNSSTINLPPFSGVWLKT